MSVGISAQTTEFSYQGFVTDNNAPANGNYDLEFRLFSVETGGTVLGTEIRLNVPVTNGVVSVTLDFGNFPNADRFLEVGVKPAGGGPFTYLAPRSKVLSTPYSTNANNAQNAVNATNATNALQLGGIVSTGFIRNQTTQQGSTNFNISGNGTVGGALTGGIVSATTQFNLGNNRILSNPGTFNLYAGVGAGTANTTGFANSFFGATTGGSNTTGNSNSYFGFGAGNSNQSGNSNSFFGVNAGASNTLGSNNSFFGVRAGNSNTIGLRNSFFGLEAGQNNLSGQDNAFFGSQAGQSNTTGGLNSFFGRSTGLNNTSGDNNSFFGNDAGLNNTTGNNNTFIGSGAGNVINQTGSNNTAIGTDATIGGNASFATAIGAGATVSSSNRIVIGRSTDTVEIRGPLWTWGYNQLAIDDTDRVVIGGSFLSGNPKLNVDGNIRIGNATGTEGCIEDRDGTVIAGNCSSDLSFKKNITSFDSVLNSFSKLRPVNFYWRTDEFADKGFGTNQSFGLIAQEVEESFPDLVSTDEQGYKVINYSKLPLYTIQAVKELKAENDALKIQLRQQQEQIDELKKIVGVIQADRPYPVNKAAGETKIER